MGGRGSSSGMGKNHSSAISASRMEKRVTDIKQELAKMVRDNGGATGLPKRYYELQSERQDLESQIRANRKQNTTRESGAANKTFVNSYGEATRREITNQTYERAQKRTEDQIMSLIGGEKKKKRGR